jgi:hypothetical protein
MTVEYLCKVCRGHLKVNTSIVLAATKLSDRSQKGLVFLDPEIGNYTKTTHPSFHIKEGEEYIYSCPICSAQLNSMKYLHLVRIIIVKTGRNTIYTFPVLQVKSALIKSGEIRLNQRKAPM